MNREERRQPPWYRGPFWTDHCDDQRDLLPRTTVLRRLSAGPRDRSPDGLAPCVSPRSTERYGALMDVNRILLRHIPASCDYLQFDD
ncbi:MAG: hypothetical protein ACJA2W_003375 [Planctomycetota bacterium]|jgi:hypothetical protein